MKCASDGHPHHPHCCYVYIPGTTYLHILLHCTLYLIAHLTPYFISLFVSYLILTIFVYIYTLSCFLFHSFLLLLCYFYFIIMFYFSFLHFPLSGPVPTNISLPIIPCMIVYVTNNKEPLNPWTLHSTIPGGKGEDLWIDTCRSHDNDECSTFVLHSSYTHSCYTEKWLFNSR